MYICMYIYIHIGVFENQGMKWPCDRTNHYGIADLPAIRYIIIFIYKYSDINIYIYISTVYMQVLCIYIRTVQ